jgi:hypothetical protein
MEMDTIKQLTVDEAQAAIDGILQRCCPEVSDHSNFIVPLKRGCCAVSVKEKVGALKGRNLILIRDVPRRDAMWVYLNIKKDSPTCEEPKFYSNETVGG